MKQFKHGLVFLVLSLSGGVSIAQSIEDGRKFMYYERYKSAKEVFQKLLASNPNNDEAAYWLGQCDLASDDRTAKDVTDTRAFYQSKLMANPNSPLLMAGIGHTELIEGKGQDARNHFEAAISLSQAKSIAVLNAVGFANGNPEAKSGDPAYAVDKLKLATQIKKFNDPDVMVNLGDAYRRLGDGGNAQLSYEAALAIRPDYARAKYRLGRLYQSQGVGQEDIYMRYYNEAIALDPKYAPVYNTLFNYYYSTNVSRSAEYLEKWLANSDDDPKACSYRASMKYAQGLFNEAITKADDCIRSEGANPYPNLYGIKALAYDRMNDSVNAKASYEEYFKRQSEDKIGPGDYAKYAMLLLKFPGNEVKAGEMVEKAVRFDSVESNRVSYLKALAQTYEVQKKFKEAGEWYGKLLDIKKNFGKTDLYNSGYSFFKGGDFSSSINVFNRYIEKFPQDVFGYYMVGKASAALDSTGALGLAIPHYQKVVEIGEQETDKEKVKNQLLGAYKYFIEYQYNVQKDQAAALQFVDKALAIDPNDEQLKSNREFISKNDPKNQPRRPATPAKPAKPAAPSKP